jgi:hypothetical protein
MDILAASRKEGIDYSVSDLTEVCERALQNAVDELAMFVSLESTNRKHVNMACGIPRSPVGRAEKGGGRKRCAGTNVTALGCPLKAG